MNGKYLGTDGKNDGKIYVVGDKKSQKMIRNNTKNNLITSTENVNICLQTTRAELSESVDVFERTKSNGGKFEECSVIDNADNIYRGTTGSGTKRDATSTLPDVPGNDNTSIHSHVLEYWTEIVNGKEVYIFGNASRPSSPDDNIIVNDVTTFRSFKRNIIVGYAPPTFGDEYHLNNRESMIYFFDRNSDLKTSLSIDTAKKILKR